MHPVAHIRGQGHPVGAHLLQRLQALGVVAHCGHSGASQHEMGSRAGRDPSREGLEHPDRVL